MGLRDVGASLPPGFRFYPNDEELVLHYLYKKITNEDVLNGTLVEIDLHTCEPWQLPEVAKLNAIEWYFFSFRDRKYATGYRTNRATTSGYWKATGKDRTVLDPITREIVGMRKTLVFYMNRAPNGIKTGWIMHEFRLETPHMPPKEDWVLCRVFHKGGNEDNSTKLIPQPIMYIDQNQNDQNKSPSLTLANYSSSSSPTNHTMTMQPDAYNQFSSSIPIQHQNNNDNYLMDFFEFCREPNTNASSSVTQISPQGEDDGYGYLWDMDLEENTSFHNGVGVASSNLDGIRFQFDNSNDNNSMIFL